MRGVSHSCFRFFRWARLAPFPGPWCSASRRCATVPSEEDVRRAYKTLGVQASATLADVKKRYGDLAKEHHPDVAASSSTSSTDRMTDINSAYMTVKTFHQAGKRLAGAADSSTGGGDSTTSSYYTAHNPSYQPWYEDVDPLMYEMMWEEMRRQNEEEKFARASRTEGSHRAEEGWRAHRGFAADRPRSASDSTGDGEPQRGGGKGAKPSTTWPEAQVKAMVHMYQDGKSFEFIANALGKTDAAAVVEEFNRWSGDQQSQRRRDGKPFDSKRRRHQSRHRPFYYAESPEDIPFELYSMMEEEPYFEEGAADNDADPFGYAPAAEEEYAMPYAHATPFYGVHQMNGGPPLNGAPYGGGGRVYNSSRKASYKPARHHRGGPPHRNRGRNANANNFKAGGNRDDLNGSRR